MSRRVFSRDSVLPAGRARHHSPRCAPVLVSVCSHGCACACTGADAAGSGAGVVRPRLSLEPVAGVVCAPKRSIATTSRRRFGFVAAIPCFLPRGADAGPGQMWAGPGRHGSGLGADVAPWFLLVLWHPAYVESTSSSTRVLTTVVVACCTLRAPRLARIPHAERRTVPPLAAKSLEICRVSRATSRRFACCLPRVRMFWRAARCALMNAAMASSAPGPHLFVDVGAHDGVHTLYAARQGHRVIACVRITHTHT